MKRYKARDSYGLLGYIHAINYNVARKKARKKYGVKNIRIKKVRR